jgi:uncharacterized membrane protein YdcZ (DUF606 family)
MGSNKFGKCWTGRQAWSFAGGLLGAFSVMVYRGEV